MYNLYLRYLGHHGWEQCDLTTGMSTSPPLQQGAEEMFSQGLKQTQNRKMHLNKDSHPLFLTLFNRSFSYNFACVYHLLSVFFLSLSYQTS